MVAGENGRWELFEVVWPWMHLVVDPDIQGELLSVPCFVFSQFSFFHFLLL